MRAVKPPRDSRTELDQYRKEARVVEASNRYVVEMEETPRPVTGHDGQAATKPPAEQGAPLVNMADLFRSVKRGDGTGRSGAVKTRKPVAPGDSGHRDKRRATGVGGRFRARFEYKASLTPRQKGGSLGLPSRRSPLISTAARLSSRPTTIGSKMKSKKRMIANLDYWAKHPKPPKGLRLKAKVLANRMRALAARRAELEAKLKA